MASFKAKFPVLQELFAKNHRGAFAPPPPAGRGLTYVKANGLAKMMGKYSFFWLVWTDWTASRRPHPADDYCSHEGSSGRNQLHHQEHGSDREAV